MKGYRAACPSFVMHAQNLNSFPLKPRYIEVVVRFVLYHIDSPAKDNV